MADPVRFEERRPGLLRRVITDKRYANLRPYEALLGKSGYRVRLSRTWRTVLACREEASTPR